MQDSLIHLIYASRACADFSEQSIPIILQTARSKNSQLGVTGMLLHIEGSFFQILEGPQRDVVALFEHIRTDRRHSHVTQIISEPIAHRSFEEWTMGYATLALREAGQLTGENDFFRDASCMSRLSPGRAKKLLNAFKGGSWRIDQTGAMKVAGN